MVETKDQFTIRLNALGHKHRAMSRGYTTVMRSDGLIVIKPCKRRIQIPIKGIALLLLGFFFFKAFMIASVGVVTYGERVAILNNGTFVEQGGAWVMTPEPVSQTIANYMGPLLR